MAKSMDKYDLTQQFRDIRDAGFKIKSGIFKCILMREPYDKKDITVYLNQVSSYLRSIENYGTELQERIKATKADKNVYSVDYQLAKKYIYANYDYASVLQFADGVIKGISDDKFDDPDDIEEFFDHTVSKAFPDRAPTTAGLISEVTDGIYNFMCQSDFKMFNSLRTYNIVNTRHRVELFKAIDKTINYLVGEFKVANDLNPKEARMYVSMVNNVMEYVNYSIAAYVTRIYLIGKYAYPFILNNNDQDKFIEAAEAPDTETTEDGPGVHIMRDSEQIICHDRDRITEFADLIRKFASGIGAEVNTSKSSDYSARRESFYKSWFGDKLRDNSIIKVILENPYSHDKKIDSYYRELNQILKDGTYNQLQGLPSEYSAKQHILHVIRSIEADSETVKGYQKLASELSIFTDSFCEELHCIITNLEDARDREINDPRFETQIIAVNSESVKILSELYRDVAEAIYQKALHIEMAYNHARGNEYDHMMKGFSIKIPDMKSDIDANKMIMTAIPDTTRIAGELLDLYALPTFEYLQMYDDYVRSLPEMQGDPFCEAIDMTSMSNAVESAVNAIVNKFIEFLNNASFNAAVEYCKKNGRNMRQYNFSGKTMENIEEYTFRNADFLDVLTKALQNFNAERDLKDQKALDDFEKSMYSKDAQGIYFGNTAAKNPDEAFSNLVLYGNVTKPAPVTLTGDQISNHLNTWLNTMENAATTHNDIKRTHVAFKSAFNHLKSELTKIKNNANTQAPSNPPSMTAENKEGEQQAQQQTTQQQQKNESMNDSATLANTAINKIRQANTRMWTTMYRAVTEAMRMEYQYIQQAYALMNNNQQS